MTAPAAVDRRRPGSTLEVAPGRVLDVLTPALRMLATYWLYDRATRTLFPSDSFSHLSMRSRNESRVVDDPDGGAGSDDPGTHLAAKFWWLAAADKRTIRADMERIFERFEVETIAPSNGCVLRGRPVVEKHVRLMLDFLRDG